MGWVNESDVRVPAAERASEREREKERHPAR